MSSSLFPGQVDTLQYMTDVSASDASNISTYQSLLLTSNLTSSQQQQLTTLTQTLTSAGKILSSDAWNHLVDAVTSVQNFFLNTVNSDINNMEAEFNAKVAKFSDKGTYNPATDYMDMNFVTWNGQSYICTQDNTINIDPSHTSNWTLVAQKGDTGPIGPAGAALSYIGTYSSLSTYQANQLVSYNGSTYICTQNNTTNQTPTNTTYWTLFVTGATPLSQSSAPTSPVTNQLWINTTTGVMEYWNGTSWANIESSAISDGTITIIPGNIGTIGSLITTVKTDLVSAINEVKSEANTNQTDIGTLANLTTIAKSNLVSAMNEIKNSEGIANGVATTDASNKVVQTANNSDKLSTARTISLNGDASGSAAFDGSANETITVTVNHASNADKLGGQLPSYYATASQANSTASGTWTPASGSLNVPVGTVINVAAIPSGAKTFEAMITAGNNVTAGMWGFSTLVGSAWWFSNDNSTYGGEGCSSGFSGAANTYGIANCYLYDGTYQANGYFQINGGYLQFVVRAPSPSGSAADTISWAVA